MLFANVYLLEASAAISPYKGCVAVPLSENDLAFHESFCRRWLSRIEFSPAADTDKDFKILFDRLQVRSVCEKT
jgi:hypothetical protein